MISTFHLSDFFFKVRSVVAQVVDRRVERFSAQGLF